MKRFRKLSKPYSRPVRKMGRLYSGTEWIDTGKGWLTMGEASAFAIKFRKDIKDGSFDFIYSMEWLQVKPPTRGDKVKYLPAHLDKTYFEDGFSRIYEETYTVEIREDDYGNRQILRDKFQAKPLFITGRDEIFIENIRFPSIMREYKLHMAGNYFMYTHNEVINILVESEDGDWVVIYDVENAKTGDKDNFGFIYLLQEVINSGLGFLFFLYGNKPIIVLAKHYFEYLLRKAA